MKGVLSKILRLAFAVLLIINTIPRNLYADEGDVTIPEPEPIVETAPEPVKAAPGTCPYCTGPNDPEQTVCQWCGKQIK